MGEIIYKKQFHRETIDEIEAAIRDSKEDLGDDSEQAITFDEIMKKIYSDVTYLVLPEREKNSKAFIKTAIEISNDYKIDIEIEEQLSHISVTYYFDCCAGMGFLREIIEMADDISKGKMNGFAALDIHPHRRYVVGKAAAGQACCRHK